jgi:Epoxide hydrolase N terminus
MSVPTEDLAGATAIRPFQVSVPDEDLVELRRRIDATRWPERETVDDDSQGCRWRPCRSSPATGRPPTTGARSRPG